MKVTIVTNDYYNAIFGSDYKYILTYAGEQTRIKSFKQQLVKALKKAMLEKRRRWKAILAWLTRLKIYVAIIQAHFRTSPRPSAAIKAKNKDRKNVLLHELSYYCYYKKLVIYSTLGVRTT